MNSTCNLRTMRDSGLEIVEREEGSKSSWSFDGISADKAIKGFGGAILFSTNHVKTMDALENILGFKKLQRTLSMPGFSPMEISAT